MANKGSSANTAQTSASKKFNNQNNTQQSCPKCNAQPPDSGIALLPIRYAVARDEWVDWFDWAVMTASHEELLTRYQQPDPAKAPASLLQASVTWVWSRLSYEVELQSLPVDWNAIRSMSAVTSASDAPLPEDVAGRQAIQALQPVFQQLWPSTVNAPLSVQPAALTPQLATQRDPAVQGSQFVKQRQLANIPNAGYTYKHLRTSISAKQSGWLYAFIEHRGNAETFHEYEVLGDGRLRVIEWQAKDLKQDRRGPSRSGWQAIGGSGTQQQRAASGQIIDMLMVGPDAKLWLAYSEVQWSWKQYELLAANANNERAARMQRFVLQDGQVTDPTQQPHVLLARDLDQHLSGVDPQQVWPSWLKRAQTNSVFKGKTYEPLALALYDPLGVARELAMDYQCSWATMQEELLRLKDNHHKHTIITPDGVEVEPPRANTYDPYRFAPWFDSAVLANEFFFADRPTPDFKQTAEAEWKQLNCTTMDDYQSAIGDPEAIAEFEEDHSCIWDHEEDNRKKLREKLTERDIKIALGIEARAAIRTRIQRTKETIVWYLTDNDQLTRLVEHIDDYALLYSLDQTFSNAPCPANTVDPHDIVDVMHWIDVYGLVTTLIHRLKDLPLAMDLIYEFDPPDDNALKNMLTNDPGIKFLDDLSTCGSTHPLHHRLFPEPDEPVANMDGVEFIVWKEKPLDPYAKYFKFEQLAHGIAVLRRSAHLLYAFSREFSSRSQSVASASDASKNGNVLLAAASGTPIGVANNVALDSTVGHQQLEQVQPDGSRRPLQGVESISQYVSRKQLEQLLADYRAQAMPLLETDPDYQKAKLEADAAWQEFDRLPEKIEAEKQKAADLAGQLEKAERAAKKAEAEANASAEAQRKFNEAEMALTDAQAKLKHAQQTLDVTDEMVVEETRNARREEHGRASVYGRYASEKSKAEADPSNLEQQEKAERWAEHAERNTKEANTAAGDATAAAELKQEAQAAQNKAEREVHQQAINSSQASEALAGRDPKALQAEAESLGDNAKELSKNAAEAAEKYRETANSLADAEAKAVAKQETVNELKRQYEKARQLEHEASRKRLLSDPVFGDLSDAEKQRLAEFIDADTGRTIAVRDLEEFFDGEVGEWFQIVDDEQLNDIRQQTTSVVVVATDEAETGDRGSSGQTAPPDAPDLPSSVSQGVPVSRTFYTRYKSQVVDAINEFGGFVGRHEGKLLGILIPFEIWNTTTAYASWKQVCKDMNSKEFANLISAVMDASAVTGEVGALAIRSAFSTSAVAKYVRLSAFMNVHVAGKMVSGARWLGRGAAIIDSIIAIVDAVELWEKGGGLNKRRAIVRAVQALGFVVSLIPGPVGWLGLAVVLLAEVAMWWLSDTDMLQVWINNGPFSKYDVNMVLNKLWMTPGLTSNQYRSGRKPLAYKLYPATDVRVYSVHLARATKIYVTADEGRLVWYEGYGFSEDPNTGDIIISLPRGNFINGNTMDINLGPLGGQVEATGDDVVERFASKEVRYANQAGWLQNPQSAAVALYEALYPVEVKIKHTYKTKTVTKHGQSALIHKSGNISKCKFKIPYYQPGYSDIKLTFNKVTLKQGQSWHWIDDEPNSTSKFNFHLIQKFNNIKVMQYGYQPYQEFEVIWDHNLKKGEGLLAEVVVDVYGDGKFIMKDFWIEKVDEVY